MIKAKIKMNWTKIRENIYFNGYFICVLVMCFAILDNFLFYKEYKKYTWRSVSFDKFTKNNALPHVF